MLHAGWLLSGASEVPECMFFSLLLRAITIVSMCLLVVRQVLAAVMLAPSTCSPLCAGHALAG